MSKLYFKFSVMNAGKSTAIIQTAFNYEERGMRVLVLKPEIDTKSSSVVSRVGLSRSVDICVTPDMNLRHEVMLRNNESRIHCVIVDEVQFLTARQVEELFCLAVLHDVPVMGYGLRTDFRGNVFPGSARMLELAHNIEEIKTMCRCGKKAVLNARKVDGVFVQEGEQVAIDNDNRIEYEALCGKDWIEEVRLLDGE